MRFNLVVVMVIIAMLFGCQSEVAKETAQETGKDIVEKVNEGVKTATDNIADAAPYLQEDIKEGFWNAMEAIEVLVVGDSPENVPTPAEVRALQLRQGIKSSVNRAVVKAADQIKAENIQEATKGLAILGETIKAEIENAKSMPIPGTAAGETTAAADAPIPENGNAPAVEDIQKAWEVLSALSNRPETAREMFNNVKAFIKQNPDLNATADIAGPVAKEKIGKKATEFLAKLQPGQVSDAVRFMNGYLIVQLIEDSGEKVEVGYIYIPDPEAKRSAAETAPE